MTPEERDERRDELQSKISSLLLEYADALVDQSGETIGIELELPLPTEWIVCIAWSDSGTGHSMLSRMAAPGMRDHEISGLTFELLHGFRR